MSLPYGENTNYMVIVNGIYRFLGGAALALVVSITNGQVPTNKPTTQNQPTSPILTINPTPSAYHSGIKINYVRTRTAVEPISDEVNFNSQVWIGNSMSNKVTEITNYLDGVGRSLQKSERGSIPGYFDGFGRTRVAPTIYDEFGRETYKYEPYGEVSETFRFDPFQSQASFYNSYLGDYTYSQNEQAFYSKTEYEPSPLNRVRKVMPPGNSWAGSGRGTSFQYLLNSVSDSVRIWNISNSELTYTSSDETVNIPTSTVEYPAGELYKNVTIDEDTNAVVEYKDKDGKLLLKKVQVSKDITSDFSGYEGWLSTYYVYDDFGRLRFVISPNAVTAIKSNWSISSTVSSELCFRNEYDERDRIIAKKVPGAGWVYMVYDKHDRLVFTQDANMRTTNSWMTNLYDGLDRVVMTGFITYTANRQDLQNYINQQVGGIFTLEAAIPQHSNLYVSIRNAEDDLYTAAESISFTEFESEQDAEFVAEISTTVSTVPVEVSGATLPAFSNFIAMTITYYDGYEWNNGGNKQFNNEDNAKLNTALISPARFLDDVPDVHSLINFGRVTGTKIKVLENPADLSQGGWLSSVTYYDDKGRNIQTLSDNFKGGIDVTTHRYDFKGLEYITYKVHHNPAADNRRQSVRTISGYSNHDLLLFEKIQLNDDGIDKEVFSNAYDNLGRTLWSTTSVARETYKYNIRGWLLGINSYSIDQSLKPWFSQLDDPRLWFSYQIFYDYGFGRNRYNGNIAGMKWKSRGDGEVRAYGFGYDPANRLIFGDFNQQFGNAWAKTDPQNSNYNIDFSMQMGNGTDPFTAYDANGNIKAMKHWGLKVNASSVIDDLHYNYFPNSNKLKNITDNSNDTQTKLGDFRSSQQYMDHLTTKTINAVDYQYDGNGNLTMDLNKDAFVKNGEGTYENPANGIIYNHLNLPSKVVFNAKGHISFVYDAAGNLLEKTVQQFGQTQSKTTNHLNGFIYENDSLQFFGHERGRVRFAKKYFLNGDSIKSFFFDYFLKDHMQNVRMVLTEQKDTSQYTATMEQSYRVKEERLFYKIAETSFPASNVSGGYPVETSVTNPNLVLSRVNGTSQKLGPAIVLRVMTGDTVDIGVKSFYRQQGSPGSTSNPLSDILGVLASGIVGTAGGSKGSETDLSNPLSSPLLAAINTFRTNNNADLPQKPKAYLNWILLDEHFKLVSGYPQSGALPVGNPDVINTLGYIGIDIQKSGYLYVYVSNETENWDVFFDNLSVIHKKGPLLEETHYYPFGLTMSGISNKAILSNYIENKKRFSGQEFDDELDWNVYQFKFRSHDPQIGRFLQIDPLASDYVYNSVYAYAENKLGLGFDLEGLELQNWKTVFKVAGVDIKQANNLVQVKAKEYATKAEPYASATIKVAKYGAIVAGILTLNPVAVTLGITTLGLTATKDIMEARKPNDPGIKEMPTNLGEAIGMTLDKTLEQTTGEKSKGVGQTVFGAIESLISGKDFFLNPAKGFAITDNAADNIDKINSAVEIIKNTTEVMKKVDDPKKIAVDSKKQQ